MRIAVITSTRADWGLLSPIARELRLAGRDIRIIAANMHFCGELGNTWREIEADGFEISNRIQPGNSPAMTAAATLAGVADALDALKPDAVLLLGDRYEILAAAQAAVLSRIPIIHIAGGAVSEGAFDDSFRHAITKLSDLHLVETDEYRRRVIQLGENPDNVITTGAIGLHNLLSIETIDLAALEESLGFEIGNDCLLATFHPATLSPIPPEEQMHNFIEALEASTHRIIFTYPNNDSDPTPLIAQIEAFAARCSDRVKAVPSLGMKRYAAALHHVAAVVGNSSSGIVEAPSAGIPTLDIGIRQKGRTRAASVVHCGDSADEIAIGLQRIFSPEARAIAARRENPYYRPDTLQKICDAIDSFVHKPHSLKHFYDL